MQFFSWSCHFIAKFPKISAISTKILMGAADWPFTAASFTPSPVEYPGGFL
jgi:hypothetical protein